MRIRLISLLMLLSFIMPITAQDDVAIDFERIQRATVFVMQVGGASLDTFCVGSGTLVRYDGLILTNAHTVQQSQACPGDDIIIAMTINPDEPPVPKYRADIVEINDGLDLALLRITREEDGRLIETDALPVLPFVELADTENIVLDDTIAVIGYPSLGNEGIQQTLGTITGFIAEPSGGDRSWMKISSINPIAGTVSGGGAYNQRGQLIGVPTSAPLTRLESGGNCRTLEDTNDDGLINSNDTCVPIGDFISVLRPVEFARPLLRSASLGLQVELITVPRFQLASNEQPVIERMYFATSVNNNLPTRVVGSVPAGSTSLYLFFDYDNFSSDTVYEIRVNVDDMPSQTFSLPPVRWSGAEQGIWYVGSADQPYPNGEYEFRIFVNGVAAESQTITIGGQPEIVPTFSNLAFGFLDTDSNLTGESYVLPVSDIASARFVYSNMQPGIEWTTVWYYNGQSLTQTNDIWDEQDGVNGLSDDKAIEPTGGLSPGNYRVDLGISAGGSPRLVATGSFVVAGTAGGVLPNVFQNIEFLRASGPLAQPSSLPAAAYPDGANTLYARFDWSQLATGTQWTMRWRVDDEIFYDVTQPWNAPVDGEDFTTRLTAPDGLPEATYTLDLLINGILLESEQVSIGIGQLAIDELAQFGGLQLRGQIVDASTQSGIAGATFVLISEDFSVADFEWRQEQIYALAVTDRNGRFEIDRSLELDSPYSVYIVAEGYLPITRDGFLYDAETLEELGGSPVTLSIPLQRD